jgi:hypothetical protein
MVEAHELQQESNLFQIPTEVFTALVLVLTHVLSA